MHDSIENAPIRLERDLFLRSLLRHLAGTLEDVVGIEEAAGYISVVGAAIGDEINGEYRQALAVQSLSKAQVARALVDLKRRIEGDFYILEEHDDRIVFGNRACPFGEFVKDRPSLCMMTSNVFGRIAAENLGYARVEVQEAIARRDSGCRVTVYLTPTEDVEPGAREYFREERDG